MENYAQPDVWLEVSTPDLEKASDYFDEQARRDEIEQQKNGLWISDPAGTILRVGKSFL